jgi:hypothetical protein
MTCYSRPAETVKQAQAGWPEGQKAPFKLKAIWAIRVRLQLFRLLLGHTGVPSEMPSGRESLCPVLTGSQYT